MIPHLALMGAFVLLARYVRLRWPEATATQRGMVLILFGLWPLGVFFRMPYAESLFVCGTVAVLYGMARGWSLFPLAIITGFVTALRPVGVALSAAFFWYGADSPWRFAPRKFGHIFLLTPLACWGLLAYAGYQWWAFGTPWAFAQTQDNWVLSVPKHVHWTTKLKSLAMLEPMWGLYLPDNPRYWANVRGIGTFGLRGGALFSLIFWNPLLFLWAVVLFAWGSWKRWLTGSEIILGGCLLGIPYLTRAYEMSMAAHGRFAAVVVVNYLVMGRILMRVPFLLQVAFCSMLAIGLFLTTALLVAGASIF